MDELSVKDNLKRVRKRLNLTQQEMAERVGLSRAAYANLETGPTRIINDAVEKVAELADISLAELVTGYRTTDELEQELDRVQQSSGRRIADLEARLLSQEAEIATLKELIDTLRDSVRTKDEIISLLKKKSVSSQHDA